jgi:ribA/ribD-fused uncharacterized protein
MTDKSYVVHDDHNIKGFIDEYRWLSNFHQCPIFFRGMCFSSTEAAYQAAKCAFPEDARRFESYSAAESKRMSKQITRMVPGWDRQKLYVMAEVVFYKFLHHHELRKKLLETGDRYIEETNHWNDTFWGVCNGIGENKLGKILMATRAYLRVLTKREDTE